MSEVGEHDDGWRLLHDVDSCNERLIRHLSRLGWDCVATNVLETAEKSDEELLRLAVRQGRIVYTANEVDFARIHARWQRTGLSHHGIVVRNPQRASAEQQLAALVALRARYGQDISNQLLWATPR